MSVTHPEIEGLEWRPVSAGYTGPDLHAVLAPRLPVGVLEVVYGYMVGYDSYARAAAYAVAHGLPQLVKDPNEGLTSACWGGHAACARLMLDWGATNYDKALELARYKGHETIVRLLLVHQARA